MLNTLKQILLEEIQTEVEEAKAMLDEIQSLKREIQDLREPKNDYLYKNKNKKYNIFEKIFDDRYKKRKIRYIKDLHAYIDRKKYLEVRLQQLRSEKDNNKLREIIEKYNKIREAKDLKELGYTFEQACNLFKEKGIPLVLDETDTIINNESNFDKLEDFVLIRKTNYSPSGDEIKTARNAGGITQERIEAGGLIFDIEYETPRDTVHFSVNGEVGDHEAGKWENSKYAIIVPLVNVDNIVNSRVEDTFVRGNVDIKKGYLLCPIDEIDKIKEDNPNLTVIGYNGENVDGFADIFISMLGYKCEKVKDDGWSNSYDKERAQKTITTTLGVDHEKHYMSTEGIEEDIDMGKREFIAIIDKLFDSSMDFDPNMLAPQLYKKLIINDSNKNIMLFGAAKRQFYIGNMGVNEGFHKFTTELWQYDIVMPSWIEDLYKSAIKNEEFEIFYEQELDNKKMPNNSTVSKETIDYMKMMLERNEGKIDSFSALQELFVYEVLRQVKNLKQEKIMSEEAAKTL